MKRTLAFSLLLALTSGVKAQTPTVVEKPAAKTTVSVANKPAPSKTAVKPSPATAKVTPVVVQKTTASTGKPAMVAVQPVPAKKATAPMPKSTASVNSKPVPVTGPKTSTSSSVKPVATVKPVPVVAQGVKPVVTKPVVAGKPAQPAKETPVTAAKGVPAKVASKTPFSAGAPKAQSPTTGTVVAVKDNKPAEVKKPEPRKINAAGRRDPFISPVVNLGAVGSGCSTGKRCLAIDQIALRGVVKSDNGMIAVVVNAMDKAYFLRENDPVFNGYVVRITGDSIIFKETFHDKLGKPLTRDITKTINRPVA
jgi:Tfp pilus assembly protein PilP